MSTFKPLLAHTIEDTSAVKFPCIVSPKLDGIRCIIIDGVAMSRSLKPIRNEYVQKCIGNREYNGLDGELIVGDMYAEDCYRVTNSGVMSKDGDPTSSSISLTGWIWTPRFTTDSTHCLTPSPSCESSRTWSPPTKTTCSNWNPSFSAGVRRGHGPQL